jgi:drug/metabolite transporter (DMT)-like permease
MSILPVRGIIFLVLLALLSFFTGVGQGLLFFWQIVGPTIYGLYYSTNRLWVDPRFIDQTIAITVAIISIVPALLAAIPAVAKTEPEEKKMWADLSLMALGTPGIVTMVVISLTPKIPG